MRSYPFGFSHHFGCHSDCDCNEALTDRAVHKTSDKTSDKMRQLWLALLLIVGLAAAQVGVGLYSHSLALLAESGHMISDGLALGLALFATKIARLPMSDQAPFGYRRVEILAALANGLGLVMVAGWIAWEAIERLQAPAVEILSLPMLITAIVGFGVNTINASLLHGDSHDDLNVRGAFLHMVSDAVSSIGVMIAAVLVWQWQWNWADGVISLGVAVLIAIGAIPLIQQSLHILLEKTPSHLDIAAIRSHLMTFNNVQSVQNLRVWTIALGQEVLAAQVMVTVIDGKERDRLLREMQVALQDHFNIHDSYLQLVTPVTPELVNLSIPPQLELLRQTSLEQIGLADSSDEG